MANRKKYANFTLYHGGFILKNLISNISVDCVIFGYDFSNLKVLLLKREFDDEKGKRIQDYKLPGSLIMEREDLHVAATRVLKELTGLANIFMRQLHAFGNVDRIISQHDLKWFEDMYQVPVKRVITIAYYSLIKLDQTNPMLDKNSAASWHDVHEIKELAFDHSTILDMALNALHEEVRITPVIFELLPKKFTIRQLQTLHEVILAEKLDNRNFRKKMDKLGYLAPLGEKEVGVAHKPAQLYKFNPRVQSKYKHNKDFLI